MCIRDRFATGLLTLLCGRATKLTDILLKKSKGYIAVIRFKNQVKINRVEKLLEKMTGEYTMYLQQSLQ